MPGPLRGSTTASSRQDAQGFGRSAGARRAATSPSGTALHARATCGPRNATCRRVVQRSRNRAPAQARRGRTQRAQAIMQAAVNAPAPARRPVQTSRSARRWRLQTSVRGYATISCRCQCPLSQTTSGVAVQRGQQCTSVCRRCGSSPRCSVSDTEPWWLPAARCGPAGGPLPTGVPPASPAGPAHAAIVALRVVASSSRIRAAPVSMTASDWPRAMGRVVRPGAGGHQAAIRAAVRRHVHRCPRVDRRPAARENQSMPDAGRCKLAGW